MPPAWMPELITFTQHGGDWDAYLAALHARFQADFVHARNIQFQGIPLRLKKHPIIHQKEATFWHFVSNGDVESERDIDFRRCERIGWPAAMISNSAAPEVKVWREERNLETRIMIFCEDAEYLTILAERKDYVLPWTAYPISYAHQRAKLVQRWKRSQR